MVDLGVDVRILLKLVLPFDSMSCFYLIKRHLNLRARTAERLSFQCEHYFLRLF